MTDTPPAQGGAPRLLTRRLSIECLAALACIPLQVAVGATRTATTNALECAHGELAGVEALGLGHQIAALVGREPARVLLSAQTRRFARALRVSGTVDVHETLRRLAAEDFRANRILELRGLWLAEIEVALLVAPVVNEAGPGAA